MYNSKVCESVDREEEEEEEGEKRSVQVLHKL